MYLYKTEQPDDHNETTPEATSDETTKKAAGDETTQEVASDEGESTSERDDEDKEQTIFIADR